MQAKDRLQVEGSASHFERSWGKLGLLDLSGPDLLDLSCHEGRLLSPEMIKVVQLGRGLSIK